MHVSASSTCRHPLRCGLSITALRRYDEAGLLPAAVVDPSSGYRYYSPDQVRTAHLVRLLRTLEVPVATIAALLADPATAADRLEQHWQQVEQRVAEGRRTKAFVHRLLGRAESTVFEVQTKDAPEQAVIGRRRVVAIPELVDFICTSLDQLRADAAAAGLDVAGPGLTLYYGKVDDESDGEVQVCLPVAVPAAADLGRLAEGTSLDTLPGGTVAITVATGPEQTQYPVILGAYDAVAGWASAHDLVLSGSPREIAHDAERIEVAWLLHER